MYYRCSMALPIPTTLDKKEIKEFQKLYFEKFNIQLSKEESIERGLKLLRFMTLIIDNNDAFYD